jgi:hypothetical protein
MRNKTNKPTEEKKENLTPEREHVRLDGATRGAIVVEASDTAIDLEGRDVEQPPFQCVHDRLPKRFPPRRTGRGGHSSGSWWLSGIGSGGGHG